VGIVRIVVQGQPGQKLIKTFISNNKPVKFAHTCEPRCAGGIARRTETLSKKTTKVEKELEFLPSKCEALS
jgi:hypothetical protein